MHHAQHPGSVRRASEQTRDAGHGYTRDQVADAERWAWAGRVIAGRAEYCFDGISFWRQDGIRHDARHRGSRGPALRLVARAHLYLHAVPHRVLPLPDDHDHRLWKLSRWQAARGVHLIERRSIDGT